MQSRFYMFRVLLMDVKIPLMFPLCIRGAQFIEYSRKQVAILFLIKDKYEIAGRSRCPYATLDVYLM